jgi:hypothetical protein
VDEGDLVRFKKRYAPPQNPPMLVVGRKYEHNKHYLLAFHPFEGEHPIDLRHAWMLEVISGE